MSARRVTSSRGRTSRLSAAQQSKDASRDSSSMHDLLQREEEYRRMNDELEQHTANLIEEAEAVMRTQQETLSRPSLLDNINADDFLVDPDTNRSPESPEFSEPEFESDRVVSQAANSRVSTAARRSVREDIPGAEDDTFLTQFRQMSNLTEKEATSSDILQLDADEHTDPVLPPTAEQMGTEAQHRFLKAKLRVMQQELERLAEDGVKKDEQITRLQARLKDAEDERGRLQRSASAHTQQLTKLERVSDELKGKAAALEAEKSHLKKELETMKRSQKQDVTSHNATEVRLNRALEEQSKLRNQLAQVKSSSKDEVSADRRRVEQLLAENRRLEKQKQELMTGLKKSLRLNHVLKQQRMHIEAAKMLEFTEEEFIKVLEWGN